MEGLTPHATPCARLVSDSGSRRGERNESKVGVDEAKVGGARLKWVGTKPKWEVRN